MIENRRKLDEPGGIRISRRHIEELHRITEDAALYLQQLINLLDEMDPDAEAEPSLGSVEAGPDSQVSWSDGDDADLEEDILDQRHDEIAREVEPTRWELKSLSFACWQLESLRKGATESMGPIGRFRNCHCSNPLIL